MDRFEDRAYRNQILVLVALLCAYVVLSISMLQSWLLAATGALLAIAAGILGRASSNRQISVMEPMLVWAVGTFALFMTSIYFVQFPVTALSASLVLLDSFILVGAWAVNSMPPAISQPPIRIRANVVRSARFGVAMAAFVSIVAAVVFGVAALTGADDPTLRPQNLMMLIAAYFIAGLFGGAVVGVLRPFAAWPLGRMVIGIPVATLLYSCVGTALAFTGDPEGPTSWTEGVGIGLGIGFIAGPAGALTFYRSVMQA